MLTRCTDKLLSIVSFDDANDYKQFENYFRAIVGSALSECKDIDGFLKKCSIVVNGENEELTREVYLNCRILMSCDDMDSICLSSNRAAVLAKKLGKSCSVVAVDDVAEWFMESLGLSEDEEEPDTTWGSYDDDDYIDESEDEVEETISDNLGEDAEEDENDAISEDIEVIHKNIRNYYSQYYVGIVKELSKRYTAMFESGYEVIKPAGILTKDGLIGLSGNKKVVKKSNVSLSSIYKLLSERMHIVEIESRSNVRIADTIYEMYSNGSNAMLYFPNKLLEYAFGRKAPSGDNQESLNTYENHASASNWSAYCESEVKKSLLSVVSGSVVRFVYTNTDDGNYFTEEMITMLRDFLKYFEQCLSLCLLMVEYKTNSSEYMEELFSIKIRVCDPRNSLGYEDITPDIINTAFMGSTGDVPFSYKPRFEEEVFVKEYAHEFNHDSSQAMPLFSYKAYESLKSQGVMPTWDKMILGMFEDGTILVNGKKGVSLGNNLTHQIDAGSRAGKGVMTLNILVSAILSRKKIFYADRKPDMASMLKNLSPNMFVVNGGAYNPKDDNYGTFSNRDSWVNLENIPDYLCDTLNLSKTWDDLGDIFYMRALKLIIGIIMARGKGYYNRKELGGESGIMFVVDEFKNFQDGFSIIVRKMLSSLPASMDLYPKTLAEIKKLEDKGKDLEVQNTMDSLNISYNDGAFYSLSFLNSLVSDVRKMDELRDASFSLEELASSDIFVIGQSLKHGPISASKFDDILKAGRYKSIGRKGVTSGSTNSIDLSTESFAYSLIDFKKSDAFFGRNMEDGRSVYLAQMDKNSKAYGRLDDKASNFAYLNTFTNDVRKKIVSGNVKDNIAIANSCVYFKPFLVLNDAVKGDTYTEQMFARCAGPNPSNPWASREDIIMENFNGDSNDPFLNYAVDLRGYLDLIGASSYSDILADSSHIANFVVRNCLGYNGDWLSFITDLRPQYIFTVGDVMEGIKYYFTYGSLDDKKPKYLTPEKNPVIEEFRKFHPSLFGLEGANGIVDNVSSGGSVLDFMSPEIEEIVRAEEMNDIFDKKEEAYDDIINDNAMRTLVKDNQTYFSEDDEIDLWGESEEGIDDTVPSSQSTSNQDSAVEIDRILRRLEELGVNVKTDYIASEKDFFDSEEFGKNLHRNAQGILEEFKDAEETVYNEDIRFDDSIESYEELVDIVSRDVISKFGGLNEITSFKAIGGSIVVNGYHYKCKLGLKMSNSLPYDLRKEINSGNISRLFDYRYLLRMPRLRDLEFDSLSFVYDYVSYGMGYGSVVSVDLFFRDLKSLQCLCIGDKLFNRNDYMSKIKGDDVFYKPRTATKLADFSEDFLSRFSKNSWSFTKNTMNSKKYGKVVKFLGVSAGLAATGVSAAGNLSIRGGRKIFTGIKNIGSSLKELLEETKDY